MWDFQNNQLVGSAKYMRDFNNLGRFHVSTFDFELAQNSGRKGMFFEFSGKSKKHLESYPKWKTIFNINYHNIKKEAVNPNYYDEGEMVVGYAELEFHDVPNPFLNYYFRSALQMGMMHSQFLRLNFQSNVYYRFTKKISSKVRIWLGGFIDKANLPMQYQTYLSGGIDPDFRNEYVMNRTLENNNISIGTGQYEISGPSLHGLILDDNGRMMGIDKWVFSINFDMGLPKIPGRPFLDVAFLEGEKPFLDFGIKKTFGPIEVIMPLYQSWDENQFVNNQDWLLDRLRIKFNLVS